MATPAFVPVPALGSHDTLTEFALSDPEIDPYGADHNPSFVGSYDDADDREAFEAWLEDDTDTGRIVREYDHLDQTAFTLSWSEAGVSQLWGGLEHRSGGLDDLTYLEFADANAILDHPEPIEPDDLVSESAFSLETGWLERQLLALELGQLDAEPDIDGLAFDDDAPESTLREARRLVGAGDGVLEDTNRGDGVTVIVIDTGIEDRSIYEDENGDRRIQPESTDFTSAGDPTVDENGIDTVSDADGHGDWVSACILADNDDDRYSGFAPEADLVTAKALDEDGGAVADIVAGVDLAIDVDADVICMSLGSPQWSEALADALEDAWDAGAFTVVASGNDRVGTTFTAHPASAEHGLPVNATNVPESGDRDDTQIANFGNVGPHPGTQDFSSGASEGAGPELAAPGMQIEIDPVGTLTGTSMAAPMVAGAAAVLAGEGHDNEAIHDRLLESAYPVEHFGVTESEYGLLDLEAALEGREHDDDQADVRSDSARTRDDFNEALSVSRGRLILRLF
ncbi:peptidase S8 (plasmid) [Natronorubrum daqingense]|uniref:Peptidase S8 n=1 Tax=Natronorubrum daqingense TaxID=588898 RepID=A0A1P8RJN9_9EURY|nr:peptidase S8 [Natronorubrum daqingense]